MIDDYYEKIRQGKQEKLFHEVIFQIGNKDDMNARSEEGQLAKEVLIKFMNEFQKRNPNLYVFSAHLHMDEETPHIHIDFVPVTHNSKRGLETRVTLKGALNDQGFKGGTRGSTELNQWINSEKEELASVMKEFGIEWKQKGTQEKHLSILDYQKKEREKEVVNLEEQIDVSESKIKLMETEIESKQREVDELNYISDKLENKQQNLKKKINKLLDSKEYVERNIRVYDEEPKWQLEEPAVIQTAKSYKDKVAEPLVSKLKYVVKDLTLKYIDISSKVKSLKKEIEGLNQKVDYWKEMDYKSSLKNKTLEEKSKDLDRVKEYVGSDKVEEMIKAVKEKEALQAEQKVIKQHVKSRGMDR